MISNIIVAITTWITHVISNLGYPGVALLMAIESAAIPLPSEIIMPFSGFLVESGRFSLFGLAMAGAMGSTVGSMITYYLGFYGGTRLIKKYGHLVHISESELGLTQKCFTKFGSTSTLFGRILPVIRTFISIPAGISKVPVISFLVYAFIGSFIWSYFLAWLGLKLGQRWDSLSVYFHKFDAAIIVILILLAGFWIFKVYRKASR